MFLAYQAASSGTSFTHVLALLLPFLGVLFLVLRAPSTRRLLDRRNHAVKRYFADPEPTAETSPTEEKAKAVYRREDDPEIANFDLSIFFRADKQ